VRKEPILAATSIIMIIVFAAAYNFQVSLALIASDVLTGDSRTYGTVMSALGMGAVTGSLLTAGHVRIGVPIILVWTLTLAAAQVAVAASPSISIMLVAIFAYGVTASLFSITVISTLQLHTVEDMRGRVMAWYSICFLGSSPLGAPAFGALAGRIGVSGALFATASICAVTALGAAVRWKLRAATNPAFSSRAARRRCCCRNRPEWQGP
jgi:MFS family permease